LKIPESVSMGSIWPMPSVHVSPVSVKTIVAVVSVTGAVNVAVPFASVVSPVS
jgi:hypothetical protein